MNRRPPKAFGARPGQSGFSLIELMVAMTLGLLLITGVGYVYLNAKGSFNSMEALASFQEVARFNFEYMGEDIRMASSTGGPASGGSPINAVNTPTSFDPRLIDLFDRPLMGYEQGGTFPTGLSPEPLDRDRRRDPGACGHRSRTESLSRWRHERHLSRGEPGWNLRASLRDLPHRTTSRQRDRSSSPPTTPTRPSSRSPRLAVAVAAQ